jgi:uncharacterized protein YjbI with pentapeptide repeats
MNVPRQAPVRLRVILPGGEGESLLEDAVRVRLDDGEWGIVELVGTDGAGKSTALDHLAHVFAADARLTLADQPDVEEVARLFSAADKQLCVCASPSSRCKGLQSRAERWRLARWDDDDCIEYLLARHPQQCSSVMRRIVSDSGRKRLAGLPELWRAVLDQLAQDELVTSMPVALRLEAAARLGTAVTRSATGLWCFTSVCHPDRASYLAELLARWEDVDASACSFLRHAIVQSLLAAEHLAEELQFARDPRVLATRFPQELVQATADLIRGDGAVMLELERAIASPERACHPMAASLLHATQPGWRPADGRAPWLMGAYLSIARWSGVRLRWLNISAADLTDADLSEAQLQNFTATAAQLDGARLHGAQMTGLFAKDASLIRADLSHTRAASATFDGANLEQADLTGALLTGANFVEANLRGCNFQRADLDGAQLNSAKIDEADFTGADLSGAELTGLELRLAEFAGAQFGHVVADFCDLEYMRLPGANFDHAMLRGALLTGSQMPDACFRSANLFEAGLADIEWERADLRDADLRGCTFHLGSSRSGLVNSPIASEGSCTGFYTDEYHEQEFKAPEEIRKANLRGADLRGALIDHVDFYLVDLRGALYTPEQEDHFRRCRAILETRV